MAGTGENSRVIREGERKSISSMSYEQKCTQPGKQRAKTATVLMFTYLHTLHHFDYSAVVGQLIQIIYCKNIWINILQGTHIKKTTKGVRER